MNIRKIIQEEINKIFEIRSVADDVEILANKTLPEVIEQINREKSRIISNKLAYVVNAKYNNDNYELFAESLLNNVYVDIIFYKGKEKFKANQVGGSFEENKTKHFIEDEKCIFDVFITVKVYNWDYEFDLSGSIKDVLNHELHHAFDHIIRIGKKSITKFLGKVRAKFKSIYLQKYESYSGLKYFLDVFCLNLPEEKNARMHEVGIKIKEFKSLDKDEIIKRLNNSTMFRDFTKMATIDESYIKNIPYNIKKEFVSDFNKLMNEYAQEYNLTGADFNYPTDVDKFFKFWINQFRKSGHILRLNVLKLIEKEKRIVVEEGCFLNINEGSLKLLFAEDY